MNMQNFWILFQNLTLTTFLFLLLARLFKAIAKIDRIYFINLPFFFLQISSSDSLAKVWNFIQNDETFIAYIGLLIFWPLCELQDRLY